MVKLLETEIFKTGALLIYDRWRLSRYCIRTVSPAPFVHVISGLKRRMKALYSAKNCRECGSGWPRRRDILLQGSILRDEAHIPAYTMPYAGRNVSACWCSVSGQGSACISWLTVTWSFYSTKSFDITQMEWFVTSQIQCCDSLRCVNFLLSNNRFMTPLNRIFDATKSFLSYH